MVSRKTSHADTGVYGSRTMPQKKSHSAYDSTETTSTVIYGGVKKEQTLAALCTAGIGRRRGPTRTGHRDSGRLHSGE